jgi:ribonuclease R
VATELWTRGIKILARLHEPPDEDKIDELKANLALLGFRPRNLADPQTLAKFLHETQNHPLRYHVHTMVLRSLKRALYSADKIGHFGLAKSYYAHFTSPIRRYPDLVLHRQLADYLDGKGGRMSQSYLVQTAILATEREQVADDASRQLIEIKKFRFLQQQIDEKKLVVYRAVVAKCTNYGAFIDLPQLAMGGMIHISQLSNQFVRYIPGTETLDAGGKLYRIGTEVSVVVASVNFDQRRADFTLAERNEGAVPERTPFKRRDRKREEGPKKKRTEKASRPDTSKREDTPKKEKAPFYAKVARPPKKTKRT